MQDDQNSTIIPETDNQKLIQRVDARDKLVRVVELIILTIVVLFNIFLGLRINEVIKQNAIEAEQRSTAAQADRGETKDYIKCVLLIRFDAPPEVLTTKEGVSKALDNCAKQTTHQ